MYSKIVAGIHYDNPANQKMNSLERLHSNNILTPTVEKTKNLMVTLQEQEFDWAIRSEEKVILKKSSLWTWMCIRLGSGAIPSVSENLPSLIEKHLHEQNNNLNYMAASQKLSEDDFYTIGDEMNRVGANCLRSNDGWILSEGGGSKISQVNNQIAIHSKKIAQDHQSQRYNRGIYISAAAVGALGIGAYFYSKNMK